MVTLVDTKFRQVCSLLLHSLGVPTVKKIDNSNFIFHFCNIFVSAGAINLGLCPFIRFKYQKRICLYLHPLFNDMLQPLVISIVSACS